MIIKLALPLLLLLLAFCAPEDVTIYNSKIYIINLSDKYLAKCLANNAIKTHKNLHCEIDSLVISYNPHFLCGDSIFLSDKITLPLKLFNKNVYCIEDEIRKMEIYYAQKESPPVAIVCDAGDKDKEIIIRKNLFLTERKYDELKINGFDVLYLYVNKTIANGIKLGNIQPFYSYLNCSKDLQLLPEVGAVKIITYFPRIGVVDFFDFPGVVLKTAA